MDVHDHEWLAARFEDSRTHLRAVAYRMVGSLSEADDAVQEAWIRLSRADAESIENLEGWLTTVTGRICLDMLRIRTSRSETSLDELTPSQSVRRAPTADPEEEAIVAEGVGLALLVVMDRLTPAERIAFVMHDAFAMPFADIATIVERSPATARKLASRARQRIQGNVALRRADLAPHRQIVETFLIASREGDMDTLLAVLDPDVVRRADRKVIPAGSPTELRGARTVGEGTRTFAHLARFGRVALLDGVPGVVIAPLGQLRICLRLEIQHGRITTIDVIAEPSRLHHLDIAVLDPPWTAMSRG